MHISHLWTGLLFASTVCANGWQSNSQCPADVVALATGIHLTIVGQVNGELAEIQALQAIESASQVNETAFLIGKGELIAGIEGGIKIREFNQAVAPANNPALPGLQQYVTAQLTELGLSESLTGVPSHDNPILATLLSDVMAGIKLNERNLANATEGCNLGVTFPAVTV
ncbi:hypothetical protein BDV97DRAFT_364914 [Delphinella strobiligena]|nr:hypothetical protein BDV97DRAFT_364914 [Delphinella strobiligena]